jgi:hypothetical protein
MKENDWVIETQLREDEERQCTFVCPDCGSNLCHKTKRPRSPVELGEKKFGVGEYISGNWCPQCKKIKTI